VLSDQQTKASQDPLHSWLLPIAHGDQSGLAVSGGPVGDGRAHE
jgi:hypothetical protein